jgi:hypothetical protein
VLTRSNDASSYLILPHALLYTPVLLRRGYKAWLRRHPEFLLSRIPAYSPNVNLIERLWKFLRAQALCRWHKTFEDMQAAVSEVLDHLEDYRGELRALMTEKFHIIDKQDIPVQYREVA